MNDPMQTLTAKLPVSLSLINQHGRYQMKVNDQIFNFYDGEELEIKVTKNELTIGLK